MKVHVYPFPDAYLEKRYSDKTVIVVDILRATTSILEGLLNGANQIVPTNNVEEAKSFSSNWGKKDCVLAGERDGLKMAEYDIGNSPFEFTKKIINEKNVVICTSNGTKAIVDAKTARKVFLGCLRNQTAVAKAALSQGNDILIICAGTKKECSADDVICAGGILQVMNRLSEQTLEFNDFALLCSMMYAAWKNGIADLRQINHVKALIDLGFEKDIEYCFEEDQSIGVPFYEQGTIRLWRD